MEYMGMVGMNRDTIQAYTNGILIGSAVADRRGDIATADGIFFTSITEFFRYSVSEWYTTSYLSEKKDYTTKLATLQSHSKHGW